MTLFILSILMAGVTGLYVARPILARRAALLADVTPGEVQDADMRRTAALASLSEIEYEFLAGKLDETDYAELRRKLSREALSAIDRADALRTRRESESSLQCCEYRNPPGSRFCGGCGEPLLAADE